MDWSKATTILIIALFITNCILGGVYLDQQHTDIEEMTASAISAAEYAEEQGIKFSCSLPVENRRLPVLFVTLKMNDGGTSSQYRGMAVEGLEDMGIGIVPKGTGDARGRLIPSSSALLLLISSGEIGDGDEISQVSLVYWVDPDHAGSSALEDTAVPAWKFTAGGKNYYIEAFAE